MVLRPSSSCQCELHPHLKGLSLCTDNSWLQRQALKQRSQFGTWKKASCWRAIPPEPFHPPLWSPDCEPHLPREVEDLSQLLQRWPDFWQKLRLRCGERQKLDEGLKQHRKGKALLLGREEGNLGLGWSKLELVGIAFAVWAGCYCE